MGGERKRRLGEKMWLRYGPQAISSSVFFGWLAACDQTKIEVLNERMAAGSAGMSGMKKKAGEMLWKIYGPQRRMDVALSIWKEMVVDEKRVKPKKPQRICSTSLKKPGWPS